MVERPPGGEVAVLDLKPPASDDLPALPQVGALPVRFEDGAPRVLLVTSRGARRWGIPKGWPMEGLRDWAAAAQEAKEEAGVVGKLLKKPIGSYVYVKRRADRADLCRVEVYPLLFEKKLVTYREKGQRETGWFSTDAAVERVHDSGLAALIAEFDARALAKRWRKTAKRD